MAVTRRDFLKGTGAASVGLAATAAGSTRPAGEELERTEVPASIAGATVTTTICPYCAVGCGLLVHSRDGKVINTEGDPEHPVNEGSLCSKGQSLFQVANNPRRLTKVLHRRPGASEWEPMSWEQALPQMARLIKQTRDKSFRTQEDSKTVNRTEGIACLGGAALDNEECYLYAKFARAMGVIWLEHQARI
jgi:formate dehydrogenase major subunit